LLAISKKKGAQKEIKTHKRLLSKCIVLFKKQKQTLFQPFLVLLQRVKINEDVKKEEWSKLPNTAGLNSLTFISPN